MKTIYRNTFKLTNQKVTVQEINGFYFVSFNNETRKTFKTEKEAISYASKICK